MLLWTSRSIGGAKRIWIQNRNLQTKITLFFLASMLLDFFYYFRGNFREILKLVLEQLYKNCEKLYNNF